MSGLWAVSGAGPHSRTVAETPASNTRRAEAHGVRPAVFRSTKEGVWYDMRPLSVQWVPPRCTVPVPRTAC